jgi:hypothetical protein
MPPRGEATAQTSSPAAVYVFVLPVIEQGPSGRGCLHVSFSSIIGLRPMVRAPGCSRM